MSQTAPTWLHQLTSERFQRLGREFLWIASGQAVAILGMLVGVRMLTGVLKPQAYGELALGMTVALLVNQVVLGPLSNASMRFFAPARDVGELKCFLVALRGLMLRATAVILGITSIICLGLLLAKQTKWLWLGITSFGFALFSGYNSILDGMQNAARQRAVVAWHQALASWGRFLAAVGMALWLGAYSVAAMVGYVLATIMVLLSQFFFFRHRLQPASDASATGGGLVQRWQNQMFTYAWPISLFGVFTWVQIVSDRWALQMFASTRDVGLYAVLFQLGYYPISLLSGLIMQLVAPIFYQRAGDATDESRMRRVYVINWRLILTVLGLTILASAFALFVHRQVFRWLTVPEYHRVSWLLPGLVLSGGFFATGQLVSLSLMTRNDTRGLIAPKIVMAIIGVLLNFIGAAQWGILGVVLAGIIFSMTYMLWIMWLTMARYRRLIKSGTESIKKKT